MRRSGFRLGGVARVGENSSEAWIWRWLEDCRCDVRHGVRTLVRTPTFTLTAVLCLAVGIGANAAIFSLVDQVLLRVLPVRDPRSILLIDWRGSQLADGWGSGNLMSYPMCRDLQTQTQFFDGVFCRHPTTVNLSGGAEHRPVQAEIVSGSYFPVLGVRPRLGRLIAEPDDLNLTDNDARTEQQGDTCDERRPCPGSVSRGDDRDGPGAASVDPR